MEENTLTLVDDDGIEKEFEILFTFESEDTNKKYVYYYDANVLDDEDVEINCSSYDDTSIFPVTEQAELDMIEEVYNTFVEDLGLGADE